MSKGGANVMVGGDYLFLSHGQANWLLNPCGGSQIVVSERNVERHANNVVCLVKQERCCFAFGSEFLQSPLRPFLASPAHHGDRITYEL